LRQSGVIPRNAEAIASEHSAALVVAWCEYADTQSGMGAGALVQGIRTGQMPPATLSSMRAEQAEYGRQVRAWLAKNFPEYDRPKWGPHPAAVAEVFRLHWRYGKGRLTKEEHGPAIHAAIVAWRRKWESCDES
jgi:hypothetical protein